MGKHYKYKPANQRYFDEKVKELKEGLIGEEEFSLATGICMDAVTRRLWEKTWINGAKGVIKNRIWKNCKFIGEDFFFTRMTGKKKESTIYHICNSYTKYIIFGIVNKSGDNPFCTVCEMKIPAGMVMWSRLKKLDV